MKTEHCGGFLPRCFFRTDPLVADLRMAAYLLLLLFVAGASFTYVSPYSTLPTANGGFCCDQTVQYAPSKDKMLWTLMNVNDSATNTLRLATAVASSIGHYGALTPVWLTLGRPC